MLQSVRGVCLMLGFLVLAGYSETVMAPRLPVGCRGPLSYLVGAVPILSAWCNPAPNSVPAPSTKLTACSQLLCNTPNCPILRREPTPFPPTHTPSPDYRRWCRSIVTQPSPDVPLTVHWHQNHPSGIALAQCPVITIPTTGAVTTPEWNSQVPVFRLRKLIFLMLVGCSCFLGF